MIDVDSLVFEPGPPIGEAEGRLLLALLNGRKLSSSEAPQMVDAFARELADKIRALPLSGTEAGIRDALADLIESEETTDE